METFPKFFWLQGLGSKASICVPTSRRKRILNKKMMCGFKIITGGRNMFVLLKMWEENKLNNLLNISSMVLCFAGVFPCLQERCMCSTIRILFVLNALGYD